MYTHEDRNNVGKEGFTTSLTCRGCAGHLFEFSFNEEDIPNAEKRLLERYGIKRQTEKREKSDGKGIFEKHKVSG